MCFYELLRIKRNVQNALIGFNRALIVGRKCLRCLILRFNRSLIGFNSGDFSVAFFVRKTLWLVMCGISVKAL